MPRQASKRKPTPKPHKPNTTWEYVRFFWRKLRLFKWLVFLLLAVGFVFEGYLVVNAKSTNVDDLQARLEMSTTVYDGKGKEAGKLSSANGTYVKLDQISKNIQNAVVSTEDKRFYHHHGFDLMGIARAGVGFLLHGQVVGGGSTLTQQLVKNSFLTNEQTLLRKFKELFIALEVEKTYTKDQILEMYLNHTYFGNGVYGVEDASEKYFGQSAKDLPLADAAVLAGALKGPSVYNPVDGYQKALDRRNLVLDTMAKNGFTSASDSATAEATEMPKMNNPLKNEDDKYQFYFDAVINEAQDKFGISEDDIMRGGYQIYTNLNVNYQNSLENIYSQQSSFPIGPNGDVAESASVAVDPYTGGVLGLIGGNEGYTFRGFNRATQMKRQPGSAIKPLNVYTPALEAGYKPTDLVPDKVQSYGPEKYTPENHDYQSVGELYLWQALAQSKNTTAVWLMNQIGVENAMKKLDAFGIPYTKDDLALSSALGGLKNGVSPLQLASAYTAFVNQGKRSEPYFITRIVDAQGNEIVKEQLPKQNKAISPEVANTMTSMMLNVYSANGTGANLMPAGYQMAGKTGTVEAKKGVPGVNDQWFVAYTPDVVVTSWYGFDQSSDDHYIWSGSPTSSSSNFKMIMQGILSNSSGTAFNISAVGQGNSSDNYSTESSSQANDQNKTNDTLNNVLDQWIDAGRRTVDQFQQWLGQ
ncbi:MAG: PBP1A family penicillin-binding protein [Aerococcus sp.]|nr:PBP1A family penicillin-binding protein [Aerococcus sp.]